MKTKPWGTEQGGEGANQLNKKLSGSAGEGENRHSH